MKGIKRGNRKLRDRIEITLTVIEEKNGSDFEDFSKGSIIHTAEEKSSKDESIFPSRTVKVISIRSLTRRFNFNYIFLILPFVCLFSSLFSEIIKRDFDESLCRIGLSDHSYFEIYLNPENKDLLHVRTRDLTTAFRDLYAGNSFKQKGGIKKINLKSLKLSIRFGWAVQCLTNTRS